LGAVGAEGETPHMAEQLRGYVLGYPRPL